jgi:hypothetical protein
MKRYGVSINALRFSDASMSIPLFKGLHGQADGLRLIRLLSLPEDNKQPGD